ncbi:CDP-alcohol phosphatidyltransferase family protein [Paenibacillus sp. YYML68]|uniref:CDP-alcohol phosphatidyltransferase family protein n=1 Tax=Paenibacillus sp. YYML68 TaxID=2909250 RepID=UPI0024924663|nr:CDP-alcohol phosphatidyltransferase family protein [Paenibacillus sp. YYML68]
MWNVPNLLTIARLLLIPVYIIVFQAGHVKSAFFVLLAAGLTDILDGHIARRNKQVTQLGSMLDPLADKLMMITVILLLVWSDRISWLAAAAIFLRDAGMIVGSAIFHFRGLRTVPANSLGKLTTVLYYIAILLLVFELPYAHVYLWLVIGISVAATLLYIVQFNVLNRREKA